MKKKVWEHYLACACLMANFPTRPLGGCSSIFDFQVRGFLFQSMLFSAFITQSWWNIRINIQKRRQDSEAEARKSQRSPSSRYSLSFLHHCFLSLLDHAHQHTNICHLSISSYTTFHSFPRLQNPGFSVSENYQPLSQLEGFAHALVGTFAFCKAHLKWWVLRGAFLPHYGWSHLPLLSFFDLPLFPSELLSQFMIT